MAKLATLSSLVLVGIFVDLNFTRNFKAICLLLLVSAERKRQLEEQLRATAMDSKKVDKIIENSDFLGRKFTKLRVSILYCGTVI